MEKVGEKKKSEGVCRSVRERKNEIGKGKGKLKLKQVWIANEEKKKKINK